MVTFASLLVGGIAVAGGGVITLAFFWDLGLDLSGGKITLPCEDRFLGMLENRRGPSMYTLVLCRRC